MSIKLDPRLFSDDLEKRVMGIKKLATELQRSFHFIHANGVKIEIEPDPIPLSEEEIARRERSERVLERTMHG